MALFDKGVLVNIVSYPEPNPGDLKAEALRKYLSPIPNYVIIFTDLAVICHSPVRHHSLDISHKQPPQIDDDSKALLIVDRKTVKFSKRVGCFVEECFHLTFYKLLTTIDSTGNSCSIISPWILEENLKEAVVNK